MDVPVASRREALAGSLVAATARVRASLLTAVSVAAGALARPPDAAATRPLAVVRAPPVAADAPAEILLSVVLPPGYHLTKGANSRFEVDVDEDARVVVEPLAGKLAENADVKLTVRPANGAANGAGEGSANAGEVRANCTVYFCRDDDICLVQRVRFEGPAAAGAPTARRFGSTFPRRNLPSRRPLPRWSRPSTISEGAKRRRRAECRRDRGADETRVVASRRDAGNARDLYSSTWRFARWTSLSRSGFYLSVSRDARLRHGRVRTPSSSSSVSE